MRQEYPRNILEAIDYYMDMGYSEDLANRLADQDFNSNYSADDYEGNGEI